MGRGSYGAANTPVSSWALITIRVSRCPAATVLEVNFKIGLAKRHPIQNPQPAAPTTIANSRISIQTNVSGSMMASYDARLTRALIYRIFEFLLYPFHDPCYF